MAMFFVILGILGVLIFWWKFLKDLFKAEPLPEGCYPACWNSMRHIKSLILNGRCAYCDRFGYTEYLDLIKGDS